MKTWTHRPNECFLDRIERDLSGGPPGGHDEEKGVQKGSEKARASIQFDKPTVLSLAEIGAAGRANREQTKVNWLLATYPIRFVQHELCFSMPMCG